MGETAKDIIMHTIKKRVLLEMLSKRQRLDDRDFDDYREINVSGGVIENAEGSALAKIGKTQVLAGIKMEVGTPYLDKPDEGTFSINAEFLPLAHASFEPGPPDENSIELARVVDRGIRSSEIESDSKILKKLFFEEGKVGSVFVDIYVLDNSGNLIDTAFLAAMKALVDFKIPKYENGKLNRDEFIGKLEIKRFPVAITFAKIDKYLLIDPTRDEFIAADGVITIVTTEDEKIAAIQKLKGSFTKDEILEVVEKAFKKGKELRKYIKE